MTTVTIETPNDIPLPHTQSEAVIQSTRVVNAMARWFGVDVKAGVSVERDPEEGDRKVVSFSFVGDRAHQARDNVAFFLDNNTDIKGAFIKPSHANKLGDAPVKMDLDQLSKYQSNAFDMAAYDAGHNGSIVSRRVIGLQGKGKV